MGMIKLSRGKSGFTLLEAIITIGLMGIAGVALGQFLKDGIYAFRMGSARLAMNAESRTAIAAITKFAHNAQGSTISISRLNNDAPANSLISGKLAETVYVYTSSPGSCGMGTGAQTIGGQGQDIEIFQDGRKLVAKVPSIPANANLDNPDAIAVTYRYITLTSNLDNIMFSYMDSLDERTIYVAARFSRVGMPNKPPIEMMLKKAVSIKTQSSAGFYGE